MNRGLRKVEEKKHRRGGGWLKGEMKGYKGEGRYGEREDGRDNEGRGEKKKKIGRRERGRERTSSAEVIELWKRKRELEGEIAKELAGGKGMRRITASREARRCQDRL